MIILAGAILVLVVICLIRLVLGPTIPDRMVALDVMNTLVVGLLVVVGVAIDRFIYVDVAIVYALLSFVSTLYLAKFIEGSERGVGS